MSQKIIPISDFRRDTSAVLRRLREGGDVVYITQHGRPAAVLMDYERYEALLMQLRQQEEWPSDFFDETYGSTADDPLTLGEQGDYEVREELA